MIVGYRNPYRGGVLNQHTGPPKLQHPRPRQRGNSRQTPKKGVTGAKRPLTDGTRPPSTAAAPEDRATPAMQTPALPAG